MTHQFDIDIATEYGLLEAILLNNLWFWIKKNEANNIHYYDDAYWTYNSTKAFGELFPYVSERQIQNSLKKLKEKGIIQTGNYNENAYDRTLWYAFTDFGKSIMQKCKMDYANLSNGLCKNVEPIPYNKPYNINNMNIIYNWDEYENCEISTKNGETCQRRSSFKINGLNYCNQHAKPIIGVNFKEQKSKKFQKPSIEEIKDYCYERSNNINAEYFYDFYEARDWMIGKTKMKDWKACVRTWERNNNKQQEETKPVCYGPKIDEFGGFSL